MHFSSELIAFMAATLFTSSIANPVPPVARPGPVKCNDPKTGITETCWDTLNVGDYMSKWSKTNYPSSCKKGEAWSVCFDRLATSNLKQDCTKINSTDCAPFNDPNAHYLSPEWFYGAYNTWSINQFLTAYYNAIDTVSTSHPASISSAAEPQDFDSFTAANSNNQVSIDVALKNLIIQANQLKPNQNWALLHALEAAPSKVLYDTTEVDTMKPVLGELLKTRVAEVLTFVESDVDAFVKFADKGAFSTSFITRNESLVDAWWPEQAATTSVIE